MNGVTIKKLADEIGVSKTAIRNKMDQRFRELYTYQDEKGVIYIIFDGEIELKRMFGVLESTSRSERNFSQSNRESAQTSENHFAETTEKIVSEAWYKEQISFLQQQLTEKDEQIRTLQQLLDQQQQLHARDQEKMLRLEDTSADQEDAATRESGKKSFWSRIFGD